MAKVAKSLKIEPELDEKLSKLSMKLNNSANALIELAIRQFVEREERLDELHQMALVGWKNYQETGIHATGEEVSGWLRAVASGKEVDPPRCHD